MRDIVLEEFPDAFLSVSHEVLPLYREFERFSTVALNAYVGPKVSRYISRFADAVQEEGFRHGVQLMQSSGGMATIESAAQRPVNLLMSGPVAGLLGGIWAGRLAGHENVVTLDIGGTSADIGVAAGGQLRMRHLLDTKVGDYQAMVPMVDIDTIGAGGGSIAYVDEGGVFRVGPQSAGADPGPACYGRGGTEPTSTDANLLLGRLRPDRGLLGGDMRLDVDLAREAMTAVAGELGMSVEEAALGALQIQKFGMTQAIELNSVRRGYDPREFTLVARRRRGRPVRLRHRAGARDPARARARPPGHHRGHRPADHRPAARVRRDGAPRAQDARPRAAGAPLRRARRRRPSRSSTPTACPRTGGWCGASPTAATPARATRCASTCRPAPIDDAWVEELGEGFHAAHEAEYGQRFDAAIEIINVRVVGIGRVDELRLERARGRATATRARALTHGARGGVRRRRRHAALPDAVLRARAAPARATASRGRRSSSSTTRRRSSRPASTAVIDRWGNIVIDCTTRRRARPTAPARWRRRSSCASSAAASRPSPRRWPASSTA